MAYTMSIIIKRAAAKRLIQPAVSLLFSMLSLTRLYVKYILQNNLDILLLGKFKRLYDKADKFGAALNYQNIDNLS